MKSVQEVVASGLCISCGGCVAASVSGGASMRESLSDGMYWPVARSAGGAWGSGEEFRVCPGKGYAITAMARQLFPDATNEALELGRWCEAWACRARSPALIEGAASGGVMTAIAAHLLRRGEVAGVLVTGMAFGSPGPRPEAFLASTVEQLRAAQGSKYCPVPVLEVLSRIEGVPGPLLFVGTPCQVAGLRLLQQRDVKLRHKFPFTVANFCGGFRDLRETDLIIRRAGHDPADVVEFRYRGGGQPGSMRIRDRHQRTSELGYPDYVRYTGVTKNRRCRLCVDATGELADFACGDAWIPRFLDSGHQWSLVLARSQSARAVLADMQSEGELILSDVTDEEIKKSQAGNLASKKFRQEARRRLYSLLGLKLPQFDGGYVRNAGGMGFELKVLVSHWVLAVLDKLGLYPTIARLIGRYPAN